MAQITFGEDSGRKVKGPQRTQPAVPEPGRVTAAGCSQARKLLENSTYSLASPVGGQVRILSFLSPLRSFGVSFPGIQGLTSNPAKETSYMTMTMNVTPQNVAPPFYWTEPCFAAASAIRPLPAFIPRHVLGSAEAAGPTSGLCWRSSAWATRQPDASQHPLRRQRGRFATPILERRPRAPRHQADWQPTRTTAKCSTAATSTR